MFQHTGRPRDDRSVSGNAIALSSSLKTSIRQMLLASALLTTTVAAQPPPTTGQGQVQQVPAPDKSMQGSDMDKMAVAMTRMAELCEQMMQMEMAKAKTMHPYMVTFAALITVILLLLVVLQVQWIIYWKRLLRARTP